MVGSPFRSWPAIQWRDIAAGAQTERRGGAGPAGACLAVRTPSAALFCANFVIRGPCGIETDPYHFLGEAGFLASNGATSKVRSSLQSVQTSWTRARTFQRRPRRLWSA